MEKEKKYNIGLDIGTTSVGWAVTELNNQQIMRKGNKALWGVRLFDEASTAETRRIARGIRRRYDRRRERIRLLQEEFKEEINKVDPNFYQKLQESKYVEKDRLNKTIILTKEEKQELKNYQNKYKTIYHLRNKLVNSLEKEDIRLVYLAIHHIIKYRGNFLYKNSNFNVADLKMKEKIIELFDLISNYNYELVPENYKEIINLELIEKALLNSSKNDTIIKIKEILQESMDKNFATEFGKLMVGNKTAISKLFMIETDKKISFSGTDYEDKYDEYLELLGDNIEILDVFKQLYDCVFLKKMFKEDNNSNISGLMIKKYDEHKEDLKLLKQIFNNNRKIYDELFRTKKDLCLYDKYVTNKIDYEDFKKELEKLFQKLFSDEKIIKSDLIPKYELEIKKNVNVNIELDKNVNLRIGQFCTNSFLIK